MRSATLLATGLTCLGTSRLTCHLCRRVAPDKIGTKTKG